ncbi:MAG: TrkH family potassium uptake protein [Candidatus Margulisbacteria bacterium]|nr:TrkH family potassium uptake protein [Candidatus Margulisiibacteriota bacterium]
MELLEKSGKPSKLDYFIGLVALFAFLLLFFQNTGFLKAYSHIIRWINLGILLIFMFDVAIKYFASKNKRVYLAKNWLDLIVFIPLLRFIPFIENLPFYIILWQTILIFMLISRTKRATKLIAMLSFRPAQLMLISFSFAIAVGTILLALPAATATGSEATFIDALFTSTSAVCVTGLIVQDTATYFSPFGQMVILALIQLGGLGIMTFSVSLALLMKRSFGPKESLEMREVLDQDLMSNVKNLVLFILKMTLILELAGALILFLLWGKRFGNIFVSLYHAFFHSISAFCNAGFSTFSDSLIQFNNDMSTNLVIMFLVVMGGLGFLVIRDFYHNLRNFFSRTKDRRMKLRIQTKLVLRVSLLLIVIGTLLIFAFEKSRGFAGLRYDNQLLISLFQSITTRTAGFNTFDIAKLSSATLFMMIVFMFIGASPGSTGGGVKTTTVAVLWSTLASALRQEENVRVFKRSVPNEVVQKVIILFVVSILLVVGFAMLLLYIEQKPMRDVLFETVSAFGTVGLSTGLTPTLSKAGKLVVTLLMFIGRLGPLTIGYAFARKRKPAKVVYAEEHVMIG